MTNCVNFLLFVADTIQFAAQKLISESLVSMLASPDLLREKVMCTGISTSSNALARKSLKLCVTVL